MTEIESIVEEMRLIYEEDAWHGPGLHAILQGVTAQKAATKPASGGHSIWELVLHIAAWENVFRRRLLGEQLNEPENGDFPPVGETTAAAWEAAVKQAYAENDRMIAVVAGLPASALDQNAAGKPYSVRYMLHGAIRHAVYHSGQISLLKK